MTSEVCLLRPGHEAGVPMSWGEEEEEKSPLPSSRLTASVKQECSSQLGCPVVLQAGFSSVVSS